MYSHLNLFKKINVVKQNMVHNNIPKNTLFVFAKFIRRTTKRK